MTMDELLGRITDLENQVSDLKNQKDQSSIQFRLNALQINIDTFSSQISEIENLVKAFNIDDRFAELFTPSELKKWYDISGLSMPEVSDYISKLVGKTVSGYAYLQCTEGDIKIWSLLGKYLRTRAIKNVKKTV